MNNEVLNAIKTRRSIRKYKAEQITDEQLDAILEAGTYAATGMGKQSPVIVVVQKPELIAKLSKMNAAVMGTTSDPFYGAPTVLIVLADPERGTYVEDGSLVMVNPSTSRLKKPFFSPISVSFLIASFFLHNQSVQIMFNQIYRHKCRYTFFLHGNSIQPVCCCHCTTSVRNYNKLCVFCQLI